MRTPIHLEPSYRSRRDDLRSTLDRTLPHRASYLGFTLGLVTTVVVVLTALGWWLVQSGKLQGWWYLTPGALDVGLRWH